MEMDMETGNSNNNRLRNHPYNPNPYDNNPHHRHSRIKAFFRKAVNYRRTLEQAVYEVLESTPMRYTIIVVIFVLLH